MSERSLFEKIYARVEPVLNFSEVIGSQHEKERGIVVELNVPNGVRVR